MQFLPPSERDMAPAQERREEDERSAPARPPEDAILEILTRTPLDALGACRCVCWQWCRLTYEPTFVSLHCHRTQTVSGYFIQCMMRNQYVSSFVSIHPLPPSAQPLSLDFLPEMVKIQAVARRGILLCTTQDYRFVPRYYVCKPATRQWCRIPNPKTRYPTRKMAMVACSTGRRLEYKIVRFSETKPPTYDLRCEIFDSHSRAWRDLSDVRLSSYKLLGADAAVTANGVFHWLSYDSTSILAFDVSSESWSLIPVPEYVGAGGKWWSTRRLVKREGRLGLLLAEYDRGWMEIWNVPIADYKEQRWERRDVVNLEALKMRGTSIILDLYSPNVAFAATVFRIAWYEFSMQKVTMASSNNVNQCQEYFPFESDFLPESMEDGRRT